MPGKGETTRRRILDAAAELFADQHFKAVTMRAIGRRADVDPSLIVHYFGSKEALFDAVMEDRLQPAVLEQHLGEEDLADWGTAMVREAEAVWASPAGTAMLAMVRRSFAGDTTALRGFVTNRLMARIAGRLPGDEAQRRLRASLVASQMAGLIVARHVVRVEPLASLPPDDVARLVGPTVQRYLTGELPHA